MDLNILITAERKKLFEDSEMIKATLLGASDALFENFKSEREIISALKFVQLSAK